MNRRVSWLYVNIPACYLTLVLEYEVNGLANIVQRTILFLIADTGAGHRSAANAIRNAIAVISQQEQEAWQARQQQHVEGVEGMAESVMPVSLESPELLSSPPTYRIE